MARNEDQPTIPGTANEQEAALEDDLKEIISRREKIKTSRAALKKAMDEAFALMKKLGRKQVVFSGFTFRREAIEKLKIASEEEIGSVKDKGADGSQDVDGSAPLAGGKANRKAAV